MGRRSGSGSERAASRACAFALCLACADAFSAHSLWPRHTIARAARLWRRDTKTVTIAPAMSISASQSWDGIDGPWSSFPLLVGGGSAGGLQNVRVLPSTASTAIWTIGGDGCPNDYVADCADSRGGLFLTNESLTWTPRSFFQLGLEINLGMDSSGLAGFDTATLGWQGSGGPTLEHSTIWNLATSVYWLGVFGLNPRPTNFTTLTNPQPSFMQNLFDRNELPSLSYGYTAGNQYRLDTVFGSLTLGGYDASRFVANNVSFPFFEDISRDLLVNLQKITTDKTVSGSTSSQQSLLPDGSVSIFIDSTVAQIWLPESACAAFEEAFGLQYNDSFVPGIYLVNSTQRQTLLDLNPSVTFTIGPEINGGDTVDITLPYRAFDLQVEFPIVENPNTSFYFPLQRAANDTQYTLGRTFLQEAYLFADYDQQNFSVSQCAWDLTTLQNQNIQSVLSPRLAATQPSSGIGTGAIVGLVLGVIAVVAIAGLLLFLYRRRQNTAKRRRVAELEAKEAQGDGKSSTDLLHPDHEDGNPFISHHMGRELDGGEIHELNAPRVVPAVEMYSPLRVDDPYKHGYSEMDGGRKAQEMQGDVTPVFEMPGSEVHELPTPQWGPSK